MGGCEQSYRVDGHKQPQQRTHRYLVGKQTGYGVAGRKTTAEMLSSRDDTSLARKLLRVFITTHVYAQAYRKFMLVCANKGAGWLKEKQQHQFVLN